MGCRLWVDCEDICRLEDADYEGHSLSLLKRIAAALNKRLEIRFVPTRKRAGRRREPLPEEEDAMRMSHRNVRR